MKRLIAVLPLLAAALGQAASPSPYAGDETREIKALSPAEVADLLAGKGMGYAKAAELNGYPGPAHVLELAMELSLSAPQRARTEAIFQRMSESAKTLGAKLVEEERALEALFRSRRATPESLAAALDRVAALQARLRQAHLQAHIEQTELLTPGQVAQYATLRGYHSAAKPNGHHHPGHK